MTRPKNATKTVLLVGSVLTGLLLSACGGADGGSVTPPVAGGTVSPSTAGESEAFATDPAATASTSSGTPALSGSALSSPATSEAAATDAVAATPQATTNATPRPPEYYESDPGVKVLRLHFLGAAKAVNARSLNIPELQRSATKEFLNHVAPLLRKEFGMKYPGPIPFTTRSVTTLAPDYKQVTYCVLDPGWLLNPKTGKPTGARQVTQLTARVKKFGSTWRIVEINSVGGTCAGVPIKEERFT
ncbi:MAG: hypothetical protein QG622_2653 [Actinomycetota bacterium]|nr:hypothetical protein [Actinomycetota bacterium]